MTLEDYRRTAIQLLLDAPLHLAPAELDALLADIADLLAVAISTRWDSASDRPAGWI